MSIKAFFPKIRFECVLCGECCRRYWIPVTHIDIARICRYTGLKPRDFIALFPKESTAGWDEPVIRLRDGEYYLVLKKRLNGTCIFNLRLDDRLVCSIHPVKPNVCRYYPFVYWFVGPNTVKFEVTDRALNYCPGIGRGGYVDLRLEARLIADSIYARGEFKAIVDKWNEMVDKGAVRGYTMEFISYIERVVKTYLE